MKKIKYLFIFAFAILQMHINQAKSQTISLENVAAELGDTVLVPLNFSGMQNIGAITLYILYDPSSIEFLGIENVISQADGILANGGYQPLFDTVAVGIAWSASTAGVNFPDGKVLDMKMAFNNTNSTLNFFEINCEIADWDANPLLVTYQNGSIYINQGAAVSIWNGTGNWTEEANWSNGIPGSITRAIINEGTVNIYSSAVTNKLVIQNNTSLFIHPMNALTVFDSVIINGTFTIKSDETGTGSFLNMGEISNSGSITVERYLSADEHFTASPVSTSTAAVFSGAEAARYNEPDQNWVNLGNTDPLLPAEGYRIIPSTDETYNFSGDLNYGDHTLNNLSFTNSGLFNYPDGMNLAGNPYPSAISWNAGSWSRDHIDASVYTWNGNQYISWNGEIGRLKDGIIPSAQGFIVFANDVNNELIIPNDARIHHIQNIYTEEKDIINMTEISINGNGSMDKTYLQFKIGSSYSFDHAYDAYKLEGSSEVVHLHTFTREGIKTSINVIPDIDTDIDTAVRIGFSTPVAGEYQMIFEANSFTGAYDLYLKDALADSIQSLSADSIYTFNTELGGLFDDRFMLYFKKPSAINEFSYWNIKVYSYDGLLHATLGESLNQVKLEIFDLNGKPVKSINYNHVQSFESDLSFVPYGIYIIRITSDKKIFSGKLMLK